MRLLPFVALLPPSSSSSSSRFAMVCPKITGCGNWVHTTYYKGLSTDVSNVYVQYDLHFIYRWLSSS